MSDIESSASAPSRMETAAAATRPSMDIAARPSMDIAARPSMDIAARPSMDIAARPSMDIALAKLRQFEAEVSERNSLRRRHSAEVYEALNATVPREETGAPLAKRACVPHNTPVVQGVESAIEEDILILSETELDDNTEEETEFEYSETEVSETEVSETESEEESENVSEPEPEVLLDIPRQNLDWRAIYVLQAIIIAVYFIYVGVSIQKIYESTK
jgi:hypothetical protein